MGKYVDRNVYAALDAQPKSLFAGFDCDAVSAAETVLSAVEGMMVCDAELLLQACIEALQQTKFKNELTLR